MDKEQQNGISPAASRRRGFPFPRDARRLDAPFPHPAFPREKTRPRPKIRKGAFLV